METGKQKWIDKAQTQTEKLTELVNSLVTLSRMDEEKTPLHFAPFAVSDAVRETAESFRDFAESNGHALRLEIAPELAFSGDEYAIRQLVSILLDNVVKYAAEGTGIAFSLEKTKKGVLLSSVNVSRSRWHRRSWTSSSTAFTAPIRRAAVQAASASAFPSPEASPRGIRAVSAPRWRTEKSASAPSCAI